MHRVLSRVGSRYQLGTRLHSRRAIAHLCFVVVPCHTLCPASPSRRLSHSAQQGHVCLGAPPPSLALCPQLPLASSTPAQQLLHAGMSGLQGIQGLQSLQPAALHAMQLTALPESQLQQPLMQPAQQPPALASQHPQPRQAHALDGVDDADLAHDGSVGEHQFDANVHVHVHGNGFSADDVLQEAMEPSRAMDEGTLRSAGPASLRVLSSAWNTDTSLACCPVTSILA